MRAGRNCRFVLPAIAMLASGLFANPFPVTIPGPGGKTKQDDRTKKKASKSAHPKAATKDADKPTFVPSVEPPKKFDQAGNEALPALAQFPGKTVGSLLRQAKSTALLSSSERMRAGFLAEVQRHLPVGRYRFEAACTLRIATGSLGVDHKCLQSAEGIPHEFRFTSGAASSLLLATKAKRFFAVLRLDKIELTQGRLVLSFEPEEIRYANPYLELLRRHFPQLPEAARLQDEYVSLLLGPIFDLAAQPGNAGGLDRVISQGRELRFGKSCPLKVSSAPNTESAARRIRLHLVAQCIARRSVGRISVLLPTQAEVPELLSGQSLTADVRLARIVQEGHQFRLVWDSIRNIRALN